MQTQTVKEKITKVVLSQPEDATYDEIMRELVFAKMVDRGWTCSCRSSNLEW